MKYEDVLIAIKAIVANDDIIKEGLVIAYRLSPESHLKMDEHLFFMANKDAKKSDFKPSEDTFELDAGMFTVMFLKEETKIP